MRFEELDLFKPFFIAFADAKQYHLAVLRNITVISACRMVLMEDRQDNVAISADKPAGRSRCPVCFKAKKKFIEKHYPGVDPKKVVMR